VLLTKCYYGDHTKKGKKGGGIWHVLGRAAYRVLVGKREGRRPLARHKLRWEDNVKVNVKGIGCEA
jgi:hypothetical protein